MRTFSPRLAVAVLAAGLVLAGCHKGNQAPKVAIHGATPQEAVQSLVTPLENGNFDALTQNLLPPAAYKQLRADWKEKQQKALAKITEHDRQRFAKQMTALTAPDAKQAEFAKLKPALDAWDSKYKQRVPMMVGIMRIMVGTKITQSDTMSADQKSQARGVLDAVATWAQNTNWGDPAKAKQAVGIVVDTARALKLKTLDDAYDLDYPEAMVRYGTAWKGFKQLTAVYGLSVDTILDSIKAKTLSVQGDTAKVELSYEVLGKPMTSDVTMQREGKRWYLKRALDKWHQEQARLAAAASTAQATSVAPAAGSSVAR
ncbi:MAG TPA: hypothetical protein VF271_01010 [Rhodanobacteraceae bacterium]